MAVVIGPRSRLVAAAGGPRENAWLSLASSRLGAAALHGDDGGGPDRTPPSDQESRLATATPRLLRSPSFSSLPGNCLVVPDCATPRTLFVPRRPVSRHTPPTAPYRAASRWARSTVPALSPPPPPALAPSLLPLPPLPLPSPPPLPLLLHHATPPSPRCSRRPCVGGVAAVKPIVPPPPPLHQLAVVAGAAHDGRRRRHRYRLHRCGGGRHLPRPPHPPAVWRRGGTGGGAIRRWRAGGLVVRRGGGGAGGSGAAGGSRRGG